MLTNQPKSMPEAGAWLLGDGCGMALSALCAAHCLAGPLLALLAPAMLGSWWTSSAVCRGLGVVVLLVAVGVLTPGYLQHGRRWVLVLGVVGVAGLLITAYGPLTARPWQTWTFGLRLSSTAALIAAHALNLSSMRQATKAGPTRALKRSHRSPHHDGGAPEPMRRPVAATAGDRSSQV